MRLSLLAILITFLSINVMIAQSLNVPLLTVTETAIAYTQVDEIHFTLTIQSHDSEIVNARNKNRKIAESVFAFLEEKKIPKQYVQTKRMQISRNYKKFNNSIKVYDGFNAVQTVYVCLKNLADYDVIVDKLLTMDVHRVSGPEFIGSGYEQAQKDARLKALKKARESAEEMAAALGQKVGKAKLVNNIRQKNTSNLGYASSSATSDFQNQSSSFNVGQLKVVASIAVSFELLE